VGSGEEASAASRASRDASEVRKRRAAVALSKLVQVRPLEPVLATRPVLRRRDLAARYELVQGVDVLESEVDGRGACVHPAVWLRRNDTLREASEPQRKLLRQSLNELVA